MKREGYSSFLLVMGTGFLLMIWAACQQWVNGSIRKRVRIAEAGRRCLMQASAAVEEGVEVFVSKVNAPEEGDEVAREIARRIREVSPGEVLEFEFDLPRAAMTGRDGFRVGLGKVVARAYLLDFEEGGPPPTGKELEEKMRKFWTKWSQVPG